MDQEREPKAPLPRPTRLCTDPGCRHQEPYGSAKWLRTRCEATRCCHRATGSGLRNRRPASSRSDSSNLSRPSSTLSVGCRPTPLRFPSGSAGVQRPGISHCRTESEGPAVPASVGARPRRYRQGLIPADPAAAAAVMLRDRTRTMGNATTRVEVREATCATDGHHNKPRGACCGQPCGSTTDKLDAGVNVWCRNRVATATADLACSTRCAGDPTSLRPSPEEPFELTGLQGFATAGDHDRSHDQPTPHKSQTRRPLAHLAPSATTPRCRLRCSRHEATHQTTTCRLCKEVWVAPKNPARPTPGSVPPGEPNGRSR